MTIVEMLQHLIMIKNGLLAFKVYVILLTLTLVRWVQVDWFLN